MTSDIPYLEVTQHAGDLVFVPAGWWHLVLNLTDTLAVTQNYVNHVNLVRVLKFLRDKPDQISGTNLGGSKK